MASYTSSIEKENLFFFSWASLLASQICPVFWQTFKVFTDHPLQKRGKKSADRITQTVFARLFPSNHSSSYKNCDRFIYFCPYEYWSLYNVPTPSINELCSINEAQTDFRIFKGFAQLQLHGYVLPEKPLNWITKTLVCGLPWWNLTFKFLPLFWVLWTSFYAPSKL